MVWARPDRGERAGYRDSETKGGWMIQQARPSCDCYAPLVEWKVYRCGLDSTQFCRVVYKMTLTKVCMLLGIKNASLVRIEGRVQ